MFRRNFREDVDDRIPLNSQPVSPTATHFGTGDVGWKAFGPAIAFSTLATVIVGLRLYTRCRMVRCVGLDDYVILLSLVLSWTMCGIVGAGVNEGVGDYHSHVGAVNTMMIAKLIVANNSVWSVCINITKASILAQYLRLFSGQKMRLCCWVLMSALFPAACWGVFGGIFLCNPTAKLWNPQIPGHCKNSQTYWVSVAAVDIALDFLTLLLPLPSISGLHLPRKQKFLTMLVFLLGFIVCAVSTVRVAMVLVSARMGDYIMSGIWSIIWSVVEANVGIVCASLLALKCLVAKIFPKLLEENEPPRHAMRLPKMLSTEPQSSSGANEQSLLGMPQVASLGPNIIGGDSTVADMCEAEAKADLKEIDSKPRPDSALPEMPDSPTYSSVQGRRRSNVVSRSWI